MASQPVERENSQFAIHNRKEIIFILEDLVKQHTMLNLEAAGGVGLVTAIVALSTDNNYIYLDVSSDEEINDKIVMSKTVKFVTHTGVRIRWRGATPRFVELDDGNAFEMPLPDVIERIQRREYFRLRTPQGAKALICKIPNGDAVYPATIVDISAGGIGISIRGALPGFTSRGAVLTGCSIEFPVVGVVPFTLKVCSSYVSSTAKNGEHMYHVGFSFENISRGASNVIQRHMMHIQSEGISIDSDE